ncbi:MAG: family 20 glycosylhydrolase [Clostridia bacterium]|nr:family 20 glycosylhydrolase [Clostridia bacterium]
MRKCAVKPVYSADPRFSGCAAVFARYAEEAFGIDWTEGEGGLILAADETCGAEEYRLSIFPEGARIAASGEKGMHNGLADLLARLGRDGDALSADEACLTEKPDCSWRGLMVDLARQRHPLPYVLSYIDLCWKNRASHLQLHFTDSPSFTLPIETYPKLPTEGRAYTREEIGILTEYAAARGITLVPEVDVPGHSDPFFRSYPELFGTTGVLPASAEAFDALRTIFSEVAAMFPNSPWIHIGGDEASIGAWENCPRTQDFMKENGIADIHEMYAEYIRILTDTILSLGRTPVVWEGFGKAYNDRIDKRTIVIAWESYYQPAYDLAASGFTLINCSWKPLYIVTPDTHWSPEEIAAHDPWRWDHWWKKSAAYPDGYRIDRQYPVLGCQLCAWGDRLAGMENWEDGIRRERELIAERLPALCGKLWHLNG